MPLVECVPNFSVGRDREAIRAITESLAAVPDVRVLDVSSGADTNRTVVTFVAPPEAAAEAAFRGIATAAQVIDMRNHRGAHARMGATDVCPFVPLAGTPMPLCVELARRLGERVGNELGIPVYLYAEAATRPERRRLPDVRQGEYEGLADKLATHAGRPDFGPADFDARVARTGATVIGARPFLVAYNVNLNTRNARLARDIALDLRGRGRLERDAAGHVVRDAQGEKRRRSGLFADVQATGWWMPAYGCAQVTLNILDLRTAPLFEVFAAACRLAEERGLRVTGSEIVGLVPLDALIETGRAVARRQGGSPGLPDGQLIDLAVRTLGLNELAPFEPARRIIEYAAEPASNGLTAQAVGAFVDDVSAPTPTPGGGSVAALAAALAAALVAMAANVALGNRRSEAPRDRLESLALRAQALKARTLARVAEDALAFDAVLGAGRGAYADAQARAAAVGDATLAAAAVPAALLGDCAELLPLIAEAQQLTGPATASDVQSAAHMLRAAVESAGCNVRANVAGVASDPRGQKLEADCARALETLREGLRPSLGDAAGAAHGSTVAAAGAARE